MLTPSPPSFSSRTSSGNASFARRDPLGLSPMSSYTRSRHVARVRGIRRGRRANHLNSTSNASRISRLDETLAHLRRIVPSTNRHSSSTNVDSYEALEALLSDTVQLLSSIVADPQLLAASRTATHALRSGSNQVTTATAPTSSPNSPFAESIPAQVDNLFTLLKLKQRRQQSPPKQQPQRIVLLRN